MLQRNKHQKVCNVYFQILGINKCVCQDARTRSPALERLLNLALLSRNLNCQAVSPMFHRQGKDLYDREIIMAEIARSCLARIPPFARWRIPQETVSPLASPRPANSHDCFRVLDRALPGNLFFFFSISLRISRGYKL